MKTMTITEYRPMIFSELAPQSDRCEQSEQAEQALRPRRLQLADLFSVGGYGAVGLWLSFDTGFAPWQWQFWLMFAPLFVAGELALRAWQGKDRQALR